MSEKCIQNCPRLVDLRRQARKESYGVSPCQYDEIWAEANRICGIITETCPGPRVGDYEEAVHVPEGQQSLLKRLIGGQTVQIVELPVYDCSSDCQDKILVNAMSTNNYHQSTDTE